MGAMKFKKISVVIPALNEEGIVGKTVRSIPVKELKKLGFETEIIVVDNASEDNTAKEAREAGAKVIYEPRRGYGSAYLCGLKEATGDIIVIGDADGTYPLDKLYEFIQPILNGGADFVICSRLKGKIHKGAMPWLHRYVGNPLLTFIGNLFFKIGVSDFHCGMRAFTREALKKMNLKTIGMEFATEMIIEAKKSNLKIREIPIEYRRRGGGKAKLSSFRDGWRHLRFMLLHAPNYLFLAPGVFFFITGLTLMLLLLHAPLKIGRVSLEMHPMVLGSLLTLFGFQIIIYSIIAKDFGIGFGLIENSRTIEKLRKYFTLEKGILLGSFIAVVGAILNFDILYTWYSKGMGSLSTSTLKLAIFATTVFIIGIEIIFTSFLMSIFSIERIYRE